MAGDPRLPTPAELLPAVRVGGDADVDDGGMSLHAINRLLTSIEATGEQAVTALKICRDQVIAARSALRRARAAAYTRARAELRRSDGRPSTAQERAAYVDEAVEDEQFALEVAEAALSYAKDLLEERRSIRSSLQTRANLVMESMRLSGYSPESPSRYRERPTR